MIDIENKSYQPSADEMCEFACNPLFNELYSFLLAEYRAHDKIEYSGDKVLLGWNMKFKKSGRTLCTVYPRQGRFFMLLVVGKKEKERVEAILPTLSNEFQDIYNGTQEGMGQRWLLLDFGVQTQLYTDVLKIIRIRSESK